MLREGIIIYIMVENSEGQSKIYFNNPGNNGLNHHGNNGGAEKWSDSEHILKAEPMEFATMK